MFRDRSEDNGYQLMPPQQQQQQQQQVLQQRRDTPGRRRTVWHRLIHSITGLDGIINDRFKIKVRP